MSLPDPKPADLITVPGCKPCNVGFARDDEYVRNIVAAGAYEAPGLSQLWAKVLRAFERRPKMRAATLRSLTRVRFRSRAGLDLGAVPALLVEPQRLDRVLTRIIRGLFWHEYGATLPADARFTIGTDPDLLRLSAEECAELRRRYGAGGQRVVGGGAFEYLRGCALDDPRASMWSLTFFGQINFAIFVEPPDAPLPNPNAIG